MSSPAPLPPSGVPDQSRQYTSRPTGASSPVSRIAKPFAEHKRNEVQAFGYDKDIHQLKPFGTAEAFIEFLAIAEELLPKATKKKFTLFRRPTRWLIP
jgi:hypothetical protein